MIAETSQSQLDALASGKPIWAYVFHKAVAPTLGLALLRRLADALRRDDPKLIQGATTAPPPLQCVQEWPCEAGCAIAYSFMGELVTVGEVEEAFARACFMIDQALGEPAGVRWFLNWFDETPREEMIALLLPEVEKAIASMERQR